MSVSLQLTLPDHLAKALVDGVPTADMDRAVRVIKEQILLDRLERAGEELVELAVQGTRVLERGDVPPPPPPPTPGLGRPEIQGHIFPGMAKR